MSSRSSILRSVLTLSSSETGGSVYSPLRRSAGAFVIGSGSGSGSDGATTFGGLAGANDRGPAAAAEAAAAAAGRERSRATRGSGSGGGVGRRRFLFVLRPLEGAGERVLRLRGRRFRRRRVG